MLHELKDRKESLPCFGEDASLYSQLHSSNDGAGESECLSDEGMGLLILDGEEVEGEEGIKPSKIPEPASLSIPDTVFLPSEVRSLAAVSCVTHENEKKLAKESKEGSQILDSVLARRNQLPSSAMPPRQSAGIFCRWGQLRSYISGQVVAFRDCSFNTVQLFPVLVLFAALLLYTSWRSQLWKNEALRMSEELQKQSALLPLTLSLLKERQSLVEKQELLEQELIKLSTGDGQDKYNIEGAISAEEFDYTRLSFKNCYVEASLSLGRCSKEWQKWWSDANGTSPGEAEAKATAKAEAEAAAVAFKAKAEVEAAAAKTKVEAKKAAAKAKAGVEAAATAAKAKAEAEAAVAKAKAEAEAAVGAKAKAEAEVEAEAEANAKDKPEVEAKAEAEEAAAKAKAGAEEVAAKQLGFPSAAVMKARLQPKPPEEEAALAAKYGALELEERAFSILVDLGMIDLNPNPADPNSDTTEEATP